MITPSPNTIYIKILSLSSLTIACALVLKLFVFGAQTHSPEWADDSGLPSQQHVIAFAMPESLTFAGEVVPLERTDIRESLDREILTNAYWHSQTLLFMKRANRYFPVIEPILKAEGVPDDFKYLALIESGLLPTAQSPAGAVGIWQFMKDTAKRYGLEVSTEVDERYHIEKATVAACKYMKEAYVKFGGWSTAAASYNAGFAGVAKQQLRQLEHNYYDLLFGEETGRYLFRILAIKEITSNPAKYGFALNSDDLYKPFEFEDIEVTGPIPSIATFAKSHGTTYKQLKMLNPWLREPFFTNAQGKAYKIKIPK